MDESLEREHEWRSFELYEKIRVRERRRKIIVISTTVLLFLGLCSVPVVEERLPKWRTLRAAEKISVELEKLKTFAIQQKKPARLSLVANGKLKLEILNDCKDVSGQFVSEKPWPSVEGELEVLSPEAAKALQIAVSVDQVCFDPVYGIENNHSRKVIVIVPVKDLSEHRLDRASYVILETESAKISIN